MTTFRIDQITDMYVGEGAGAAHSRNWQFARDLLINAAKAGDIAASLEQPISPPEYIRAIGLPRSEKPKSIPEINSRSRVSVVDAAKVFNAGGYRIPEELLRYMPQDQRAQFDLHDQARELTQREKEKRDAFSGMLIELITSSSPKLRKSSNEINEDALAEMLLPLVSGDAGRAIHGWSKSSLKSLIKDAVEAFDKVKNSN